MKDEAEREKQRRRDLAAWQEREDARERNTGFLQDIVDGIESFFDPKPSTYPIRPTPISAVYAVRSRQRAGGGGSSMKTSADPDRLRNFRASSLAGNWALRSRARNFASAWAGFVGACTWAQVDAMTCVTAFEQLLSESGDDAAWAGKLADLFEIAGGGALSSSVLDAVDGATSRADMLRLWATEFTRDRPELLPLLGDRIDDVDFLEVLSQYQDVFDDQYVDASLVIVMLDDVAPFARDHTVLHQNLDTFLLSDTSDGIQVLHRLEIAQIFARADVQDASAILLHLDGVTIIETGKGTGGNFRRLPGGGLGGEIRFDLYDDQYVDSRGKYFTLLHEMGHAADYNFGLKSSDDGWITGGFTNTAGETLDQVALNDFVNDARPRLDAIAVRRHPDMSEGERNALVDETIRHLTEEPTLTAQQFRAADGVSQDSARLYQQLQDEYTNREETGLLDGPDPSMPSDVFGGITNHKVQGTYGHGIGYWFDGDTQIRTVEKELFASAVASRVLAANGDTAGLDAIRDLMPGSEELVDQIINEMGIDD